MPSATLPRTIILVGSWLCLISLPSHAIEFIETSSAQNWFMTETVAHGCVARQPNAQSESTVWIGECKAGIPHGRGFLIERGFMDRSAGMNNGQKYNRNSTVDTGDLEVFSRRASYLADLYGTVFAESGGKFGPGKSPQSRAAGNFMQAHADADVADVNRISKILQENEKRVYSGWLLQVQQARSSNEIRDFLSAWANHMPPEQRATLERRQASLQDAEQKAEQQARARRMQEAAARESERERLRQTACSRLYPGFVGRYRGGGWLATADPYVVRYVNSGQKTVTIEGTETGNSLARGQYREMSCFDLIERSE